MQIIGQNTENQKMWMSLRKKVRHFLICEILKLQLHTDSLVKQNRFQINIYSAALPKTAFEAPQHQ